MAWTDWPPVAGSTVATATDFQFYNWIEQIPQAIRERAAFVQGMRIWPINYFGIYFEGKIYGAITDNGDGTYTFTAKDSNGNDLAPLPEGADDNGEYWSGAMRGGSCSGVFWAGVMCTMCPFQPSNYDVIIDNDPTNLDPYIPSRCPIRGLVTANTNNTITFSTPGNNSIPNHITAKTLSSLASLSDKRFHLIKSGNPAWSDKDDDLSRYIAWPNDSIYWEGYVTAGSMENATTGFLRSERNRWSKNRRTKWAPDLFAGKEVLVYAGNVLKRYTIVGNSADTLYFGTNPNVGGSFLTLNADGPFMIGPPNFSAFPDRINGWHKWWYGGHKESAYSHVDYGSGAIGSPFTDIFARHFASGSVRYAYTTVPPIPDCPSLETNVDTLDIDVYVPYDNCCTPRDHYYAPHLHKTIRGWQADIENLFGGNWVKPKSYDAEDSIPNYTFAQCMHDCGINSGTATVSGPDDDDNYFFTVSATYYNQQIWYVVKADDGDNYLVLSGFADGSGKVTISTDMELAGKAVVYTAGWTRYFPLEFRFMYDAYSFIPDLDGMGGAQATPAVLAFCCGELGVNPGDPECCKDCNGVGVWHKRVQNLKAKAFSSFGYATEDRDFVNGDLVRYAGQAWTDGVFAYNQIYSQGSDTAKMPFWDYMHEGKHHPNIQRKIRSDTRGIVVQPNQDGGTKLTTKSLTAKDKDWWKYWYSGGVLTVHTGAAEAGSTTTLTTDDFRNDPDNPLSCWWNLVDRFPYATYPFQGFILEVDKTESVQQTDEYGRLEFEEDGVTPIMVDATVTYKLPITNVVASGTAFVIHFEEVTGFEVEADDIWRIREPKYTLNRYLKRVLKITFPDGTQHEREITHSDDVSLFWATALSVPIPHNSRFKIVEFYPGGVWKYSTTAPDAGRVFQKIDTGKWWILQDRGTDARSPNPAFRRNSTENAPFKSDKRFGKIRNGDYVYFDTFMEMYTVLNKIWQNKQGAGTWVDMTATEPADPAGFTGGNTVSACANGCETWAGAVQATQTCDGPCGGSCGPQCFTTGRSTTNRNPDSYYNGSAIWQCLPPEGGGPAVWTPIGGFFTNATAHFDKLEITTPSLLARDVDFYNYAVKSGEGVAGLDQNEWDANGADVLEKKWSYWDTKSIAAGVASVISAQLGNLDTPSMPTDPQPPGGSSSSCTYPPPQSHFAHNSRGYRVTNREVIAKWQLKYCTFDTF